MICASTLSGYLNQTYLVENFGLSDGYAAELRRVVRQLNEHAGYEVTLYELSPPLLCRWLKSLLDSGASPVTINNKRREIITLWRASHNAGLAEPPPEERIKKLNEPAPLPTAWTTEECGRIFAATRNITGTYWNIPKRDWWLSLFLTVYCVGERINATRFLKTLDCNLQAGTITIRWQTQKTNKNRLVWLIPEAVRAIERIYDPSRELLWPWPHCERYLFTVARRIIESAKVACPKHGENALFQRMRRTSGSLIEAAGGDGARHLGNTRAVFEKHYRAESICSRSQVHLMPRPVL